MRRFAAIGIVFLLAFGAPVFAQAQSSSPAMQPSPHTLPTPFMQPSPHPVQTVTPTSLPTLPPTATLTPTTGPTPSPTPIAQPTVHLLRTPPPTFAVTPLSQPTSHPVSTLAPPTYTPKMPPTVAFLADSISDVWYSPYSATQGLQRAYLTAQYGWLDINKGVAANDLRRGAIANSTVEDCGEADSNPMIQRYQNVLSLHPDIIVVEAGTNDAFRGNGGNGCYTPNKLEGSMIGILAAFRDAHIRVYVYSIPSTVAGSGVMARRNDALQSAMNATVGGKLINVTGITDAAYVPDGIHLDQEGAYALWYAFVEAVGNLPADSPLLFTRP